MRLAVFSFKLIVCESPHPIIMSLKHICNQPEGSSLGNFLQILPATTIILYLGKIAHAIISLSSPLAPEQTDWLSKNSMQTVMYDHNGSYRIISCEGFAFLLCLKPP